MWDACIRSYLRRKDAMPKLEGVLPRARLNTDHTNNGLRHCPGAMYLEI
jgi:hypothetical protein